MDVCRQSITFDSVSDMAACLRAIREDDSVAVVRVKNRLSPAYDATTSCGYRDVNLNLCIDTPATRRLGVQTHICELQLCLKDFALIKVRACGLGVHQVAQQRV